MNSANAVANGGKLDDCHSSIYSLAEMKQLRWRTYSGALSLPTSPSDDPILVAFSKCLAQDVLAVWRKKPNPKRGVSMFPQGHPHNYHDDEMNANCDLKKELWIFWWGNENDSTVEDIGRNAGLSLESQSSWEEQGLTYECRALLFKAIHNLIEKCMLSRDYVRIGKWFVRPLRKDADEEKCSRLSVSFMFFLRGENTVCTTVDIAHHQTVEKISSQYLYQVTNNAASKNVILSPYGLRATLTGVVYKSPHEQVVKTVIDEWNGFYPIKLFQDRLNQDDSENVELPVPPVVEVFLSGVRMNYPSAYVLVPFEKHTPVKERDGCVWNSEKRGMENGSHHGDFPSIGSFQDSVGLSANEMVSSPISDFSSNPANTESTSSLVKKLISRVVSASQMSSKPETNGVVPISGLSDSHPSPPENTVNWPVLNCQFKRARQRMNFFPAGDEDLNQAPGKQKYLNDFVLSHDVKRKAEKQKLFAAAPFHRRSAELNPPQNNCLQPILPAFQQNDANSLMMMYPQQQVSFENYPPFDARHDEKTTDMQMPAEPMYFPNSNDVASAADNFTANTQLDPGTFQYGVTDQAIGNSAIDEMKELVSVWSKVKIPNGEKQQKAAIKTEKLPQETLESDFSTSATARWSLKKTKGSTSDVQNENSWTVNSRKRKVEEVNLVPKSIETAAPQGMLIFDGTMDQVLQQHVRVGAITGELAGMPVLDDPYEFEDDEKDNDSAPTIMWSHNGTNNSSSDIFAHKNSNVVSPLKWDSGVSFSRGMLSVFDETMVVDKPGSSSLMEQRDMKVSTLDLNKIFEEDDDDNMARVKFEVPGIFSNAVPRKMNEESLKFQPSKFSVGGNMKSQRPARSNVSHTGNLFTVETLSNRLSGSTYGYENIFENETVAEKKVLWKQPLCKQPLTDKYAPLRLRDLSKMDVNGKMLGLVAYTPSCFLQVEPYVNAHGVMPSMDTSDDINFMQVGDAPTPIAHSYSVSTPASVPQQSPAPQQMPRTPRTPRAGSSPATSTPNPAVHGRFPVHTPLTSVSSSVAQSEIGNCRASSIYVTLMLSDSVLNFFRDISFDQCPMCVCNDNIRSRDVDLGYLPSLIDNLSDAQYHCTCGFSAVRNRILSVGAGLFLEDELEIVGKDLEDDVMKSRDLIQKPSDRATDIVINFAIKQAPNPYLKIKRRDSIVNKCQVYNIAAQQDIVDACVEAINGGITVLETSTQPKIQARNCKNVIHQWIDTRIMKSPSSSDMFQLMQNLKHTLQDAIQSPTKDRPYNFIQHVNGPLTWREFCKDNTVALEPLPIPMLLVGQNFDWATISPFGLSYWEKLYLEPYAGTTQISYIALCPGVEHVFTASKFFFTELSQLYDLCRLGTHKPLIRNTSDNGLIRVSNNVANNIEVANSTLGNPQSIPVNHVCNNGKKSVDAYAAACRDILYPLFNINSPSSGTPTASHCVTIPPGSLPNSVGKPGSSRPSTPLPGKLKAGKEYLAQFTSKQNSNDNATLVLYFIDPFFEDDCSAFSIAIWKCYKEILASLPPSKQNSVVIQLVSLEDILQYAGSAHKSLVSAARSLAFSSYFQCRHRVTNQTTVRTMTAFGPASTKSEASAENKSKPALPAIHSPPYILAGHQNTQKDSLILEKKVKDCNILYVIYCLSHDQKWLIASATDQDGEMLETFCVNIDVPPRRVSLRKKHRVCIKSEAIQKLWNLCLSLITSTASLHWRIVIGRLGRLGHGEIQEWNKHLSRRKFSQLSKDILRSCNQCSLNGAYKHPSIYSACLTSMEPEGSFTILPDSVKLALFGRSSNTGQQVQIKTPEDASCTHIYVFPTSSFVQTAAVGTFQNDNDDLLNGFAIFGDQDDIPLDGIVNDLFTMTSPGGNPTHADDIAGHMKPQSVQLLPGELAEEMALQQQPLALGYYVSTAPTGPLPDTFWVSCPHAQSRCPVFLRFALHLQVSSEEVQNMGAGDSNDNHHQLDSHKTADVLRYVMENYNALSWLTCDPVSKDRRSCLPINYFVLTRLYHAIKELT